MYKYTELKDLVGKTFTEVKQVEDEIHFIGEESFRLAHEQGCCESVNVEDIVGDLSDLENTPILVADDCNNNGFDESQPRDKEKGYSDDSFTWTFFRISTIKGTVVIRFYGTSNGYYSETASIYKL